MKQKKKGKKGKSCRATAVSIGAKFKLSHDILMPAKVHLKGLVQHGFFNIEVRSAFEYQSKDRDVDGVGKGAYRGGNEGSCHN